MRVQPLRHLCNKALSFYTKRLKKSTVLGGVLFNFQKSFLADCKLPPRKGFDFPKICDIMDKTHIRNTFMAPKNILAQRSNKVIYRDGDKLIKLFDESYSKSNIFNEALGQTRVAETGLNVPKIHEVTVIGGKSAIVMDFIEGDTLEELLKKYPGKRGELLALFVKTQREVHAKKHLLLTKYADKLRMKILQSDLAASTRYDLAMRLDGMRRHTHVLQGDFVPRNVVVKKDGTPYIVDWSHVSQGNATADGAKTYLLLLSAGLSSLAEEYRKLFCKAAGVEDKYFVEWLPLVSAAQLIRAETPERRAFLMHYVEENTDDEI